MKKILAAGLLVATAFFGQTEASDPRYAYVFVTDDEVLNSLDPVDWGGASGGIENVQGTFSEGVFVDPDDTTTIVIKHPGTYQVSYSATLSVDSSGIVSEDDGDAQLALYLNNSLVPGSIYAVGNAFSDFFYGMLDATILRVEDVDVQVSDGEVQLNGTAIVTVIDHFSRLNLVNQGENTLDLVNDAGTDDTDTFGNNVSVSIFINRLDKHHED